MERMWDSLSHLTFVSSFKLMTKVFRGSISHQSKNILPEGILSLSLLWEDDVVKKKVLIFSCFSWGKGQVLLSFQCLFKELWQNSQAFNLTMKWQICV